MNTYLYVLGVVFLIGQGVSQSCSGYDCLKNYIDRPEPAYKWTDTGARLRGRGVTVLAGLATSSTSPLRPGSTLSW